MTAQLSLKLPVPEGYEVIFRTSFTDKSGKVHFARNYGKRAFRIVVRKKEH